MQETPEPETEMTSAARQRSITVKDVWKLPDELFEISGNVMDGPNRMACIDDNTGTIYLYNLSSRRIDDRIVFTGPGDFEAIAKVGNLYYALRSDGMLYQVQPRGKDKPVVEVIDLPLEQRNDTESMFYDAAHNRLLIGVKEKDPTDDSRKGIYAFDLKTKTMTLTPVIQIEEQEKPTKGGKKGDDQKKEKKATAKLKPSEIAIHPATGELYILNGPKATLVIAEPTGKVKQTIALDKTIFPQPEGMCFSDSGAFYISSEGAKGGSGVIAHVVVN